MNFRQFAKGVVHVLGNVESVHDDCQLSQRRSKEGYAYRNVDDVNCCEGKHIRLRNRWLGHLQEREPEQTNCAVDETSTPQIRIELVG
jgi:hypothetical protein